MTRRAHIAPKGLRPGQLSGKTPAKVTDAQLANLTWYYRGCTTCGVRFCVIATNAHSTCQDCRLKLEGIGTGRPLWDRNGDPAPCCLTARLIDDADTLVAYRCAGPTLWWQCHTCKRCHPYNPKDH